MKMARDVAEMYKRELADRYYKKQITFKQYDALWDQIELEDYDLSMFPQLSEKSITWINKIFQDTPDTDRKGNFMLRGFTRCEGSEMKLLNLTYGDYADGLSFYAYNDKEMMIYTYTEGDTTLTIFSDRETYSKEKAETNNWYRKEKCA